MKRITKIIFVNLILTLTVSCLFACSGHSHVYSDWAYDSEFHWQECECGEDKGKQSHVFTDEVCECGYQKPNEHTHNFDQKNLDEKYLKSPSTCVDNAVYYYSCSCGQMGELTFEYGEPKGHDYGEFVDNGDGTKTATCKNGCGIDKTISKDHVHEYTKKTVAPTCDSDGYTLNTCECSHSYKSDTVPKLNHTYGNYISNGDGTHKRICGRDSSHVKTDTCYASEDNKATCTKLAVCDYCKKEFGGLKPHVYYNEYSYDSQGHWKEAACGCDVKGSAGAHSTSGTNCQTCSYPVKPTDGIVYDLSDDKTYAMVMAYTGSQTKIRIADTYQGKPVKVISESAFYEQDITMVVIPDSVEIIENSAFSGCGSLTEITFGNGLKEIGSHAFYFCSWIRELYLPDSLEKIGLGAFAECAGVRELIIGDGVKVIEEEAFSYLYRIEKIKIGKGIQEIECKAFYYCGLFVDEIEVVFASGSNPIIDKDAFYDCDNLKYNVYENCKYLPSEDNPYFILIDVVTNNMSSYTIHEDTVVIANEAFSECNRLGEITIPKNVRVIGKSAFLDCDNLQSVDFKSPSGWSAEGTQLAGNKLSDKATAADYLKNSYKTYAWLKN